MFISASKAIKLLGINRKEFANDVKSGKIREYDGCIILDELKEIYPDHFDECRNRTLLDIVKDQSYQWKGIDLDNLEKSKLLHEVKMLTAKVALLKDEIKILKEK